MHVQYVLLYRLGFIEHWLTQQVDTETIYVHYTFIAGNKTLPCQFSCPSVVKHIKVLFLYN